LLRKEAGGADRGVILAGSDEDCGRPPCRDKCAKEDAGWVGNDRTPTDVGAVAANAACNDGACGGALLPLQWLNVAGDGAAWYGDEAEADADVGVDWARRSAASSA
jgi:hypothetical protein